MKSFFKFSLLFLCSLFSLTSFSQVQDPNNGLKHYMTPEEALRKNEIGRSFVETDPPSGIIRNVEEFGPTESVLIRYPFGIPMSLIKEMAKDGKVITIVNSASQQTTVNSQYQSNGVNTANCSYLIANSDSYWTRDYGPWYITYGDNQTGIVDFPYNRPRPNDDEVPKKVAQLQGIEWFGMNVIHTGGNYMTDGMHQSSSTTLVWEENPTQTHEQVAQKMHDYLGIDNYMVEEDPNGTYIDHIDCWGKFLGPDKVLIRKVPVSHPQYSMIEATASFYASQISSYGTPYRVYRVNTPNDEPYTNSYIMNNKVFVPFMGTANDAGALLAYQQAMPGYLISGYLELSSASWESTDALHCRTHEMSDRGMLYIEHMPLSGTLPAQAGYTITANITAFSQQAVYPDSVWVIYKVNGGSYDTLNMVNTSANHYSATIPGQMEGSTIAYYIHAEDASGRSENHPFIGAPDPHKFEIAVSNPPDIVVSPDTLFYSSFEELYFGKEFKILNYTSQPVSVTSITSEGTASLPWYIDPFTLNLPYAMAPGENLTLNVRVHLQAGKTEWVCDPLSVATETSLHQVMICADPSVLTSRDKYRNTDNSVSVFPNPAATSATFTYWMGNEGKLQLEIYSLAGKKVYSKEASYHSQGIHSEEWDLTDSQGNRLSPGLYFYSLIAGTKHYTGKISVTR
ncbi:MAG: agmatine deiminase family protein [Bacteroidales bacterium]|nr:agmatine deiminase family protein [Bacteroidales bacterium]